MFIQSWEVVCYPKVHSVEMLPTAQKPAWEVCKLLSFVPVSSAAVAIALSFGFSVSEVPHRFPSMNYIIFKGKNLNYALGSCGVQLHTTQNSWWAFAFNHWIIALNMI